MEIKEWALVLYLANQNCLRVSNLIDFLVATCILLSLYSPYVPFLSYRVHPSRDSVFHDYTMALAHIAALRHSIDSK